MRILVLSNLYPPDVIGGYEIGCHQVVHALRDAGHEVLVITSAPRVPVAVEEEVDRTLRLTDIYDFYSRARSSLASDRANELTSNIVDAYNVHRLLIALRNFRPDVAYLWNLAGIGGLGLLHALRALGVPSVWHLMDCVPSVLSGTQVPEVAALGGPFHVQAAGIRFIACSQRVVEEIAAAGIDLDDDIDIVPNWVCGSRPPRRQTYMQDGILRIVCAGRISPDKGSDILVLAARRLLDGGLANFSIDLFGTLEDERIRSLVHQSGLEEYIKIKGFLPQSELLTLYRNYDLFAFPTWAREPFGFSPLEASLQGCVTVMSADCGIAEWMVGGVHCLKAERTPEAFAATLRSALLGELALEELGARASEVIWRDFHITRVLPRIEEHLTKAASTRRVPAQSPEEVYQLAILAEKLGRVLIEEAATSGALV